MNISFVSFWLDDNLFGVDVRLVREINQLFDITPVPRAEEHVRGLMNLRGQIVTMFDISSRLGLENREINEKSHNVVFKKKDELRQFSDIYDDDRMQVFTDPAGILVDYIGDIIDVDESEVSKAPANVEKISSDYVSGVVTMKDGLMVILDVETALRK